MDSWKKLIHILERHQANSDYVAECVYAHLIECGFENEDDGKFVAELLNFLKEE